MEVVQPAEPKGKVKSKHLLAKGFRGRSQTRGVTSCDRHESKARTDFPPRKQESDDGVLGRSEKHINCFVFVWFF